MHTFIANAILAFLTLTATAASAQEEPRYVFGVASNEAIEVLIYDEGPDEVVGFMVDTFTRIQDVPGFEGCRITYGMFLRLVCGEDEFTVNSFTRVGDCQYTALHRDDGLGLTRKATWEASILAARVCGAPEEDIARYEARKTSMAGEDADPRFR